MSVTCLEMHTAVIWDKNRMDNGASETDRFLSYLKDFASEAETEETVKVYTEPDGSGRAESQKMLKELIRKYLPTDQIVEYTCEVKGRDDDDKTSLKLLSLETFADSVLKFLKRKIDAEYPETNHIPLSDLDTQRFQQEEFLDFNCRDIIGREAEMNEILDYIHKEYGNELHSYQA